MITLKKLLNTVLAVSCIASMPSYSYIYNTNPTSLILSGGIHALYPLDAEFTMWGVGGEANLYISRATNFCMNALIQLVYMSGGDFDLGTSYDIATAPNPFKFNKVSRGGLKNTSINGRISLGREIMLLPKSIGCSQERIESDMYVKLYTGLGVALEASRFQSKDPKALPGSPTQIEISWLQMFSVIPGIDLKLFYILNSVVISPGIFVGASIYGRSRYSFKDNISVIATIKTKQSVGVATYISIPIVYKLSDNGFAGIRYIFVYNYREEKIRTVTDGNKKIPYDKRRIETLGKNVRGSVSIQFTYVNS
ncbi:MAG: hypothetical protein KAH32_01730 [Chlamydiia bacterium]|nr:hypothetical protein [Chlamydiia bacterium]